ncbi:DUF4876 domain-containing protein [candidate division KSB1 bacterium]|nr:DUF4876 domain-containing protein [candidate division KSB1 bacterium]
MRGSYRIIICIAVIGCGCSKLLDPEEIPTAVERQSPLRIFLQDQSGFMQTLYGSDGVRDGEILLKSNRLRRETRLTADSTGLAVVTGLISDTYLISASRAMTPEEMALATGQATAQIRLVNSTLGLIDLRADQSEPVTVPMYPVAGGSPLVISEIYGCGPPGSGLYFHDKYVEIYNQSDETVYLDSLLIAVVYASSYTGENFIDDPEFIHSSNVWMFPGKGSDYPLEPGHFAVCAADGIDHRNNAPNSVDLSGVRFEFYKRDAPDIDNPLVPNMKRILQDSGYDWLIGGEKDALVLAKIPVDSLGFRNNRLLIPYTHILDGVEYLDDPSRLDKKKLNPQIDAGATGGIEFYTGKSMERIALQVEGRMALKDDNNSSLDFRVLDHPTPEYHHGK